MFEVVTSIVKGEGKWRPLPLYAEPSEPEMRTRNQTSNVAPAPSRDVRSGITAVWCDYEMPMFMGNGTRSSTAREYPCPTE